MATGKDSTKKLYGAVLFTPGMDKVAMVKIPGLGYQFPFDTIDNEAGKGAAAAAVKKLTGLVVDRLQNEWMEVTIDADEDSVVRLYCANKIDEVPIKPEASSHAESAEWRSFDDVFELPQDATAEEYPWLPFVSRIQAFLNKHPEFRVTEPDPELAAVINYYAGSWVGPSPKEHLAQYCSSNEFPQACYNTFVKRPTMQHGSGHILHSAACILPHLGLQISPERGYQTEEEAEQASALFALIYLEGGIALESSFCRITPVGYHPSTRPELMTPITNDEEAAESMRRKHAKMQVQKENLMREMDDKRQRLEAELQALQQQKAALEEGGEAATTLMASMRIQSLPHSNAGPSGMGDMGGRGRGGMRPRIGMAPGSADMGGMGGGGRGGLLTQKPRPLKRARMQVPGQQFNEGFGKNPIQELKELCDKHKWQQPLYDFTRGEDGNHVCAISLPQANFGTLRSPPETNLKRAKAVAANLALTQLQQLQIS